MRGKVCNNGLYYGSCGNEGQTDKTGGELVSLNTESEKYNAVIDQKKGDQKKRRGSKPPVPAVNLMTQMSDSDQRKEEQQRYQAKRDPEVSEGAIVNLTRALVRWTAVLAIATFLLGIVAIFQWSELNKTDDHIKNQADTMQRQLNEMKAEQRPWIAIIATVTAPNKVGDPLKIDATFNNVGHKPAFKLRYQCEHKVGSEGDTLGSIEEIDETRIAPQSDGIVVLPGTQTSVIPAPLDITAITQVDFENLLAHRTTLSLSCRVEYFDGEVPHKTTVRLRYNPDAKSLVTVNPGNDAD